MKIGRIICVLTFCVVSSGLNAYAAGKQIRQSLGDDIHRLYSKSAKERADATSRLVDAGPAAIPLLLPVLCDKSKPNFDLAWRHAAKALGELKAEVAAPCLVQMLALGDVTLSVFKPEKTILDNEPSFAALVEIGEPAVPAIARYLPTLHPDQAYLALRVLRVINTPSARVALEDYIKLLQDQTRLAKEVLDDFQFGPGVTR
jgi:hypothetical protein